VNVHLLPDHRAVLVRPEVGDDPSDLEDTIHDALTQTKPNRDPQAKPAYPLVILDVSDVPDAEFPRWLKAAGPEIPDANLRVVVSPKALLVAKALKLTAHFEWYDSLESAVRGGA
jgi:hypothetical protein